MVSNGLQTLEFSWIRGLFWISAIFTLIFSSRMSLMWFILYRGRPRRSPPLTILQVEIMIIIASHTIHQKFKQNKKGQIFSENFFQVFKICQFFQKYLRQIQSVKIKGKQGLMLKKIWDRKIYAIITMNPEDICDTGQPLPLFLQLAWNHYVGFYYEEIINFFMAYAPFPFRKEEFYLLLAVNAQHKEQESQNTEVKEEWVQIMPEQIVSHAFHKYSLSYDEPWRIVCRFRRTDKKTEESNPNIDLQRNFKNNLKASTALRYGKYGASRLTVEMSNRNVEAMYEGFLENNMNKFMGSYNFQEDENLGYSFLVHNGDKIPVRILGEDFQIQRASPKQKQISEFLTELFDMDCQLLNLKLHGIALPTFNVKMYELEKYCHPDGFLYFHM